MAPSAPSPTSPSTPSSRLRKQGNDAFAEAKIPGLAPSLVQLRLEKAIKLYNNAFQVAATAEERVVARKNASVASSRLFFSKFENASLRNTADASRLVDSTMHVIRELVSAIEQRVLEWQRPLDELTADFLNKASALLDSKMRMQSSNNIDRERIQSLDSFWNGVERNILSILKSPEDNFDATTEAFVNGNLEAAQQVVNRVVSLLDAASSAKKTPVYIISDSEDDDEDENEDEDETVNNSQPRKRAKLDLVEEQNKSGEQLERQAIRDGLALLQRARPFILRAEKHTASFVELISATANLSESLALHSAILTSRQYRLQAEQQLSYSLSGRADGTLVMDGIWIALDSFKTASVEAREKDLEGEAIALSRMAHVYSKIIKGKDADRAHALYLRAIELAAACHPRSFHGIKWYDEAVLFIQAVREARERAEAEALAKEEDALLQDKREECKAIDAAAKRSAVHLLKHIYGAHPPRNGSKLGSTAADDLKATLKVAITAYHPDRHPPAPEGASVEEIKEAAVKRAMASYITKRLTPLYECMK